ncbi:MAG: hypothetical protein KA173_04850 [Rhodoferax sp.]|nr:hypothetical protein [Rhodoferax sp.]
MMGDGNGDGIKDSEQNSVTSITFLQTPTAQSNPGDAPVTPISLVADSLTGKSDPDPGTAVVTKLEQQDAPADMPAELTMPLGLLSFKVNLQANAGSGPVAETFSLYVDPSIGANGYWVQNADGIWCNLASAAYGGQMVLEGGKLRLDFQLVDGGEFDTDGLVNGNVSNVGAAANMPLSLVGYAPTSPTTGDFFF